MYAPCPWATPKRGPQASEGESCPMRGIAGTEVPSDPPGMNRLAAYRMPVPVIGTLSVCVPDGSVHLSTYTPVNAPALVGWKVTGSFRS